MNLRQVMRIVRLVAALCVVVTTVGGLAMYFSLPAAGSNETPSEPPGAIDSSALPEQMDAPAAPTEVPVPAPDTVDTPTAPEAAWPSWSFDTGRQSDRGLADPAVLYADREFHGYATSSPECGAGSSDCPIYWVPHFAGPSLAQPGQLRTDAMPQRPDWVAGSERHIWAPSVARVGGHYVLYFAATAGRGTTHAGLKCLGAAVATTPDGPFVPQPEPLRCASRYWAIDPYVVDDAGDLSLLWREDDASHVTGRIVGAPLTADGLHLAAAPQTMLTGEYSWEEGYPDAATLSAGAGSGDQEDRTAGQIETATGGGTGAGADVRNAPVAAPNQLDRALGGAAGRDALARSSAASSAASAAAAAAGVGPIENPAMARHPVTGLWLLTWSANRWETAQYATGLAVCQGPLGPCERVSREAPWLRSSGDDAVAGTTAQFAGAGGLSFVTGPSGELYAVFHAYRDGDATWPGSPRVGWAYVVEATADGGYRLAEFA